MFFKIKFLIILLIFPFNFIFSYNFRSEKDIINNPKDIVEYFLIFPSDKYIFLYGLSSKDNATFNDKKEKLKNSYDKKVTIDIKNYYLNINEEHDFPHNITFTIFLKKDKIKIFVVSEKKEYPSWTLYRTNFFKYEDKKWININNEVLPKIDFNLLYDYKNVPNYNLHYNIMKYDIILPRKGTKTILIVRLGQSKEDFEILKEKNIINFNEDKYFSTFKNMKYLGVELDWNWVKGKFYITKKILNNNENQKKYNIKFYNLFPSTILK